MAIKVTMRKLMGRLGAEWKRKASDKLRSGLGFNGRRLRRKKFSNGRPLGVDKSPRGIEVRMLFAPVRTSDNGFSINLLPFVGDSIFHTGSKRQPPRPIVGFSNIFLQDAADRIIEQIARAGRRGRLFL